MSSSYMHGTGSPWDATQRVIPTPFPPTTRHLLTRDAVSRVIPIPSNSMLPSCPHLCTKLAQPRMLHEEISLPIPSHPAPLSSQQNTCVPWDITPGIICIPSHHTTHACLKMLHQEVTPTPSPVLNVPPEVKSPLQGYQLPGPLLSPGIPTWRQGCRLQHRWAGRAPGAGPRVPVPRESGHG